MNVQAFSPRQQSTFPAGTVHFRSQSENINIYISSSERDAFALRVEEKVGNRAASVAGESAGIGSNRITVVEFSVRRNDIEFRAVRNLFRVDGDISRFRPNTGRAMAVV